MLLRPGAEDAPPSRHGPVLLVLAGAAPGLGVTTEIFFGLAALVVVVRARRRAGCCSGRQVFRRIGPDAVSAPR